MTQMMSKYFSYSECVRSETAIRRGLDNTPTPEQLQNLTESAYKLDRVREFLGAPIHVSSGFRSPKVNKAVGSRNPVSAHTQGYAFDITCPTFGTPQEVFEALRKFKCGYDQIIVEFPLSQGGGWVHISFDPRARGQALVTDDGENYRVV